MKEEFTISIFTEDHIGIFNQITNILTRRQINIDSITCSGTAVQGVSLITLVVKTTYEMISKVAKQMERIIDVLKVFVHTSDQIIYQEIALYKVSANSFLEGNNVDHVVRTYNARIIEITPEYIVLEKTGHRHDIKELQDHLTIYGLLQVSRSGRVAITKQVKELNTYLMEMDEANSINSRNLTYIKE
jgi:acetolactate synthase-1/3 small subunit